MLCFWNKNGNVTYKGGVHATLIKKHRISLSY